MNLDLARLLPKIGPANAALARHDGLLQSVVNPAVMLSPLTQREAVLSSEIFESSAPHSNWLVHLLIEFVGPNLGCVWLAVLRFALQVPYEHFSSRAESLELLPHPAR